jgi:hypothetical protein
MDREVAMARNLRSELEEYRKEFGIVQYEPCSNKDDKKYSKMIKEGFDLPNGIIQDNSGYGFRKISYTDLSDIELEQLMKYRKWMYLKTIKNCAVYFTVISVLGLILLVILLMG